MYVLIADSHVVPDTPQESAFFTMLDRIANTSYNVIFLGDNLDIWIASAPKYENHLHEHFLQWCRSEKQRREVILVEGNHEFYVKRHYSDCFSACSEDVFRLPNLSFTHGDMTHYPFSFHRLFRAFAKNSFGDFIMSILPCGVPFAHTMKKLLAHKKSDKGPADYIPYPAVDHWVANEAKESGSQLVFMGHFHCGGGHELSNVRYVILPAWKDLGTIALLDETTLEYTIDSWEKLIHE